MASPEEINALGSQYFTAPAFIVSPAIQPTPTGRLYRMMSMILACVGA
jgi:hypothetical protein